MIHKDYLTPKQIQLTEHLKGLRGADYYNHSIKVYNSLSESIEYSVKLIIENHGKLSSIDIATIALKYNINFKLSCEFLEKLGVLRLGTYNKISAGKTFSIGDAMDAARQKNNWK